jgi:hypothetical protein
MEESLPVNSTLTKLSVVVFVHFSYKFKRNALHIPIPHCKIVAS